MNRVRLSVRSRSAAPLSRRLGGQESYWIDAIIESENTVPFATLRKRAWASANSLLATKASDHSFRIV